VGRGSALVTPGAFEPVTEVDVRVRGEGSLPDRPLLHLGSAHVAVHARPLGDTHARLRLQAPLPLRHGDRAVLRDPGSRSLWGVEVVDAAPPPLDRRGAARARATELAGRSGDLADEVTARGVVRRSLLRRLGVSGAPPLGALSAGDWLVSAERLASWRTALAGAVADHPDGLSSGAAVRLLELPEPSLLDAVVTEPVVLRGGRLVVARDLDGATADVLGVVRADLEADPFRAPDADRLAALGLDRLTLARLAREGHVLLLGDSVVLLPGADDEATDLLSRLDQPFTTSQARQALGTSRRVVLPLLAHLDRTGRTVRLPDDTRRIR
jgi:selenocysteine-specific elongation factor